MKNSVQKKASWEIGDWVIYRKQKRSDSPGPRAEAIHPDAHGEKYTYVVDKYWIVEGILNDGQLQLITKRGKRHEVPVSDPRLRVPTWWERLFLARRFKEVESVMA